MPITKKGDWEKWEKNNTGSYGKACIDVAREVMNILDKDEEFDASDIISEADKNIDSGGITGFMAGCVASMVSHCHSRGEEFREKWNKDIQIGSEGEEATKKGTVLNPALLNIDSK